MLVHEMKPGRFKREAGTPGNRNVSFEGKRRKMNIGVKERYHDIGDYLESKEKNGEKSKTHAWEAH